jgi:hypothetical protein
VFGRERNVLLIGGLSHGGRRKNFGPEGPVAFNVGKDMMNKCNV